MHQIIRGGDAVQPFHFRRPRQAANAGFAHQNGHQTLAHLKFHPDRQLRMHPARTVGLPGRDMDFADQTSEPEAPHLRGRYRSVFVSVIAGAAHSEEPATQFGPVAGLDEVVDTSVNPFGPGRSSPRSFAAIFKISTSVSSCRIRFFALDSSAVSGVDIPGHSPRSI